MNKTALERTRIPLLSEIDTSCNAAGFGCNKAAPCVSAATTVIDNGTLSVNYRDVKNSMVQTIHVDGQSSGVTYNVGEKFTIAWCLCL